jgi:hypothetical protein
MIMRLKGVGIGGVANGIECADCDQAADDRYDE